MNKELFNKQNITGRAAIVREFGEYISVIDYYNSKVELHIVEDCFVEVFYDLRNGDLEQIQILDPCEERLNRYITGADLSSITPKFL